MKSFFMTLIALAVCAGLFWGFVTYIGKSMKSQKQEGQGSQQEDEQSDQAKALKKKQKLLMEEREQQLREYHNRNH